MHNNFEKEKMMRYFRNKNLSLHRIVNDLFTDDVKRITYLGTSKLKQVPEYNFSLLKFNVVLENYYNYIMYVKLIDNYQVDESLFCYWLFYEEKYLINKRHNSSRANIKNYNTDFFKKRFELQLQEKDGGKIKSSIVDIIDLNRYSYKNISKNLFIALL